MYIHGSSVLDPVPQFFFTEQLCLFCFFLRSPLCFTIFYFALPLLILSLFTFGNCCACALMLKKYVSLIHSTDLGDIALTLDMTGHPLFALFNTAPLALTISAGNRNSAYTATMAKHQ
jgi:hypothetical protein